jgi:hypothetical protein
MNKLKKNWYIYIQKESNQFYNLLPCIETQSQFFHEKNVAN